MADPLLVVVPAYGHWDYVEAAVVSLYRAADASAELPLCRVYDDAHPDVEAAASARDRLLAIAEGRVSVVRYPTTAGMTRAWNDGLVWARDQGLSTVCLTNSDVLFSPGWDVPLRRVLAGGYWLAGPVSNAPGRTNPAQLVLRYLPDYTPSDDWSAICTTAERLRAVAGGRIRPGPVNGFCLLVPTATAWAHPYGPDVVFDPGYPMGGNEDELQRRWRAAGGRFAVAADSFVFHYRSVTRGDRYRHGLWWRRSAA